MPIEAVCDAIEKRMCLELFFDSSWSVVEPHLYGVTLDDHDSLRAWRLRGGADPANPTGWILVRMDGVTEIATSSERAYAPRIGYRRSDPAFKTVYRQI